MSKYFFQSSISPEIVKVHSFYYGDQIWTKCKVRTNKKCVISGDLLKGKEAFRPLGNTKNRMERIDATIIQRYINLNKEVVIT